MTTTINQSAVALFTRLLLDPRVTPEAFARDMVRQNRERLEWLKVKPEIAMGRAKDLDGTKQKYLLLINSETSVRFQQQYVIFAGCQQHVPRFEFDEIVRAATLVMQHYRDANDAMSVLHYLHPDVLEAVCTNLLAADEGTVAPQVEVILRNVVKAGGIDRSLLGYYRPTIVRVSEQHWTAQPDKPARQARSAGRMMGRTALAMAAGLTSTLIGK